MKMKHMIRRGIARAALVAISLTGFATTEAITAQPAQAWECAQYWVSGHWTWSWQVGGQGFPVYVPSYVPGHYQWYCS
jgi:hypothetical protein